MNPADVACDAVRVHGCGQDIVELALMLNIVESLDPRVIVEIGCNTGGSLYAWTATGAEVIGVSLGPHDPTATVHTHGATLIQGDSHHVAIMEQLEKELGGRRPDFFFIDGDHSEAGCRSDWILARRVRARVVGFHDISARRIPGDPGVRKVFAEACARYPSAVIRNPADPQNPGAGIVWILDE